MFLFIPYDHWSGIQYSPLPLPFNGRGSVFFSLQGEKRPVYVITFHLLVKKVHIFRSFSPQSEKNAI